MEAKIVWTFYCPRCKIYKQRNFGSGRLETKLCHNCMEELYPEEVKDHE